MITSSDCIDCFLKQVKNYSKLLGYSSDFERQIFNEVNNQLKTQSLLLSPPEIAYKMSRIILKYTSIKDPFLELKMQSNEEIIKILNKLMLSVEYSSDRLLKSVELAIAGNIIDYGAKHSIKLEHEINKILDRCSGSLYEDNSLFSYRDFHSEIELAKNILYIGDNCGEIVFDKLFIEELQRQYPQKKITFIVRNKPVLNDATYEDAKFVGLTKIVEVLSSGCNTPGTVLKDASDEFMSKFKQADLIISKGQGNFEALSDIFDKRIYYLFIVKCEAVAKTINAKLGEIILTNIVNKKEEEQK